uniref:Reverse transcriptase zinc-binding domain-containing protein n=1 Tax=Manihot esculenta TaxID=3983 RepID=A0A2C9WEW5_MANES
MASQVQQAINKCKKAQRHISNTTTYEACHRDVETTLHVLRDCGFTRNVWKSLAPRKHWDNFFTRNIDIQGWLNTNLQSLHLDANGLQWRVMFRAICWGLWHIRNEVVF